MQIKSVGNRVAQTEQLSNRIKSINRTATIECFKCESVLKVTGYDVVLKESSDTFPLPDHIRCPICGHAIYCNEIGW